MDFCIPLNLMAIITIKITKKEKSPIKLLILLGIFPTKKIVNDTPTVLQTEIIIVFIWIELNPSILMPINEEKAIILSMIISKDKTAILNIILQENRESD